MVSKYMWRQMVDNAHTSHLQNQVQNQCDSNVCFHQVWTKFKKLPTIWNTISRYWAWMCAWMPHTTGDLDSVWLINASPELMLTNSSRFTFCVYRQSAWYDCVTVLTSVLELWHSCIQTVNRIGTFIFLGWLKKTARVSISFVVKSLICRHMTPPREVCVSEHG